MKMEAGFLLYNQKPHAYAQEQEPNAAVKYCPFTAAASVKKKNAMADVPTARPSILSKKFI